ncbi:DUF4157 domain-containing protein [Paenibacillus sp. GYB004]|uniref:eCIS core domain-containing protein n=1 Tax=Paenibacillus sp. GYB004 TaxID=2994393 RepID=UPI002F9658CB
MSMHSGVHKRPDGDLARQSKQTHKPAGAAADHPMMQLQRTIGNKAIGSMLTGAGPSAAPLPEGVQAKLTVGPAGDAYEQEADQVGKLVADRISSASADTASVQRESEGPELEEEELQMKRSAEGIQREFEGPELEEEELQMKRSAEGIQREFEGPELEEEELQMKRSAEGIQRESEGPELEEEELQMKRSAEAIQRASSGEGFDAGESLEQEIEQKRGGGSPMDMQVQAKMESAFGSGFSDVNIHTDTSADRMAESIGATAFTTGSDIFFRQGQYNPDSRQGQELLGHELTHVVQQRGGAVPTEQQG